jgi:hypothetical protein
MCDNQLECPYCKFKFNAILWVDEALDDEGIELNCGSCQKGFILSAKPKAIEWKMVKVDLNKY